jgi:hypothetical protein
MSVSCPTHSATRTLGELCVGGDWACAHGDGLRYIAQQLAACAREPLHCALMELADACVGDPDRAVLLWSQLKNQVYPSDPS